MNQIRGYRMPITEDVDASCPLWKPARIDYDGRILSITDITGLVNAIEPEKTLIASTEYRWITADSEEITPNWRP